MSNGGKPTNERRNKAGAPSGSGTIHEAQILTARVKREGLKGDALITEVARRLAQNTLARAPQRVRNGGGKGVGSNTRPRVEPHTLSEHAGHLARKIFKFFPFHTRTVPPVDYDEGSIGTSDGFVPYEQNSIRTITVPAGSRLFCYFAPGSASAGRYVIFTEANTGATFFDKTAGATWPFDGVNSVPLQSLYPLINPPNVRAAFGSWGTLDWSDAASSILGVSDGNSNKFLVSGGVSIEAYTGYTGHAEVRWLAPSDNPVSYGPSRPDLGDRVYKWGLERNAFHRVDNGNLVTLATALPATAAPIRESAMQGVHSFYAPPTRIPTTDEFSPQAMADLCKVDILQGGGDTSHRAVAWTFHTEEHCVSTYDSDTSINFQPPNYFHGYGANPTAAFSRGQGFFIAQAVGADLKLIIRVRASFAGTVGGPATHNTARADVKLFNDDDRDDHDEHSSDPDAHESIVGHTAEEVVTGVGVAGLVKAGISSPIAKQIGSAIASKAPGLTSVAKTVFSTAESGLSFLTSHLGSLAKSVLPKVITVGEDVAEAAAFL